MTWKSYEISRLVLELVYVRISPKYEHKFLLASLFCKWALESAEDDSLTEPRRTMKENESSEIDYFPLWHGGIRRTFHERLKTEIDAQTAVATLRFYRPVQIDRIELPPIVYGRGRPPVPVHPAHIVISVFDREKLQWDIVQDVELPANPKFSGFGLTSETKMEEMVRFFEEAISECPPHTFELEGLVAEHVRIECDSEHPAWPNHGECNGERPIRNIQEHQGLW